MKYKWKLHPSDYALGENEKFYSVMEAKGWRLKKRGAHWSQFEQVLPSQARYRIEVAKVDFLEGASGALPEEQLAIYEDCGWEYITSRRMLHFFRAPEGSDAPEFYQDPRQQAETLKGVRQSLLIGLVVSFVFLILLVPILLTFRGGAEGLIAWIRKLWLLCPEIPLFYTLILLSGVFVSILDTWQISRTYRRLKKGIPLDHAPKKRGLLRFILDPGLPWLAMLCLVLLAAQLILYQRDELPIEPDGPYLVLRDLGWNQARTESLGNTSRRDHTRTFLAEFWETREYVENSGNVEISLYQEIYCLKNGLDPMDWVDSLTVNQIFVKDLDAYTRVEIEGLEAAWVAENGMEAIAVQGQRMAYLTYLDGQYSTEHLVQLLEALSVRWAVYK